MAVDGRSFARDVLRRYRVRPEAIDAILAASDWEIHDPNSVSGGGTVYPAGPNRWRVVLYTAQEEACLHEAAHVWWWLWQDDARTWLRSVLLRYRVRPEAAA